jgi:hypothetical protein
MVRTTISERVDHFDKWREEVRTAAQQTEIVDGSWGMDSKEGV